MINNKVKVFEYLNSIFGRKIKLGVTDCNTIVANLLDLMHGTSIHKRLTENITREKIRNNRASTELINIGYKQVSGPIKTGDFIILEGKYWSHCMFIYRPNTAISCFDHQFKRIRKVVSSYLTHLPPQGIIYRHE